MEARSFAAAPRFDRPILFLYGSDAAIVDALSAEVAAAFRSSAGSTVAASQMDAAELSKNASALNDFFAAVSLFGDRRLLHIANVTERAAKTLTGFAETHREVRSDDLLILSSSSVRSKSALLSAFRALPSAHALSCYELGLDARAIATLSPRPIAPEASSALEALSATLDPMSFRSVLQKLDLYGEDGAAIDQAALDACLAPSERGADGEMLEALFAPSPNAILSAMAAHARTGDSVVAFLAALSRTLSDATATAWASRGVAAGRRPFWKIEKAVQRRMTQRRDLPERLDRALLEAHRLETVSRSTPALLELEVQRGLLRLHQILSR